MQVLALMTGLRSFLEPYESGRESHAKRIVALLQAENIGLNRIWETLMDGPACIRFVRETGNEGYERTDFENDRCLLKG